MHWLFEYFKFYYIKRDLEMEKLKEELQSYRDILDGIKFMIDLK